MSKNKNVESSFPKYERIFVSIERWERGEEGKGIQRILNKYILDLKNCNQWENKI